MKLTKGLIRADIIAARQAIANYDENRSRISKTLPHIICSRQLKN